MSELQESREYCPYCGEPVLLLVDPSVPEQQYVEDCSVCCQPMDVRVVIDQHGLAQVRLRRDDE